MLHGGETWPVGGKVRCASEGGDRGGGMDVRCEVAGWSSRWGVERETGIGWHDLSTTVGHVAMVWECVAKGR